MPQNDDIQHEIADLLQQQLPATLSPDAFRLWIAQRINDMIVQDFEQFLSLLYIIDIDEKKVKAQLKDSNEQAGIIIADMIIARQLEKKKWREYFRAKQDNKEDSYWD